MDAVFHGRAAEVAAALATVEAAELGAKRTGVAKCRYTHDAMIDLIIGNPEISQGQIAAHFGYTEGWVSQILNSDVIQARLAQRRDEVVNPALRLTVEERFRAVTQRSLDILQEKLAKPNVDHIPDNLVLKAIELGGKALGVGGNAPPPSQPTDHLAGVAERLLSLQGRVRRGEIVGEIQEVEVVREVPAGHGGGSQGRQGSHVAASAHQGEAGAAGQADGGGLT